MRLDQLEDDSDYCQECGTRLPQDRYWGRRQYCTKRCTHRAWWRLNADWLNEKRREQRLAKRLERGKGRTCEECGGPIPPIRRLDARWCSVRCGQRNWDRRTAPKRAVKVEPRPCAECGKVFTPKRISTARWCSRLCNTRSRRKMPRPTLDPRPCALCGTSFTPRKHPNARYCSTRCVGRSSAKPLPVITCEGCHKTFTAKRHRAGRVLRFCSRECFQESRAKAAKGGFGDSGDSGTGISADTADPADTR